MTPEAVVEPGQDFEALLYSRERLPDALRMYILDLSKQGLFDEGSEERHFAISRSMSGKQARAYDQLLDTIPRLLSTTDPAREGYETVRMIWLMYYANEIDNVGDRRILLEEAFDRFSDLGVDYDFAAIRDEVEASLTF